MSFITKLFGDRNAKIVKGYKARVEAVNGLEQQFAQLSDDALKGKTAELRERLSAGATLDDVLVEAFALVREASKRTLGLRHFDVQLIGGMLLHDRSIAEMRTGEGKTLVSTLPAYLNALNGEGVHIVTVNDYLARRDAVWMGQVHSALGLTVAVINHDTSFIYDPSHTSPKDDAARDTDGSFKIAHEFLRPVTRHEAYRADIVYATNSELGFDYLRDNLEYDPAKLRQRGHAYAIVDEIDSILIDEARTPLIISGPSRDAEHLYAQFAGIVSSFKEEEDYTIDEKRKAISLTDSAINKAEKALNIDNIYTDKGVKYVHHLEVATKAKALYIKDREYVVRDGKIVIVDEFTGRMQPGRRWSDGLHQAIEAKERVPIERETKTYASITYQNYFRLYKKLGGMTGTAMTSSEEFFKVYGLEVVAVPTNVVPQRKDHNDLIFQSEVGKFKAIARAVKERFQSGQPILIGTVSIEKNELLSAFLKKEGVPHETLNAKNHESEGMIVAQAGRKGAVTIATNMAGRGVDIKLGGVHATPEQYEEIKSLGGLFVIGTERHEARRIDNQLRGRSGRQGDPGETQFFVSLEDSLMRVFASDTIKKMMGRFGIPEDEPIQNGLVSRALESAQSRIEGLHFDARKHVLEFDNVLNQQRMGVYGRRHDALMADDSAVDAALAEYCAVAGTTVEEAITPKRNELGDKVFYQIARRVILHVMDTHWMLHLEGMDNLRSAVNLRSYGQREPLVEYKREGLAMYKSMQEAVARQVVETIPRVAVEPAPATKR